MNLKRSSAVLLSLLAVPAAAAAASADSSDNQVSAAGRAEQQFTTLLTRSVDGGLPNGPSTHAVISGDRRFSRIIAFESEASDLVRGDVNGQRDVFAIKRGGSYGNNGNPWTPGATLLVSRGVGGAPANGPSWGAAVNGDFRKAGSCVAFLSAASNLVRGDTNGKTDAFLVRAPGRAPKRVSLPGNRQAGLDTTQVAVSGDCSRVSFVTGGKLYTRVGRKTRSLRAPGLASDPSYAHGETNSLVFAARGGVHLSAGGTKRGRLIAPGGSDPAFMEVDRYGRWERWVAYEKSNGGDTQVFLRELGGRERAVSTHGSNLGNGDSTNPVIGNSGYYVTFQSEASNLGVNALGRTGDHNGLADAYLYTRARDITLVQSVEDKAEPLPGGGENPSMSFYANYILFDSPGPLGEEDGDRQVYMRYLGAK